MEDPVLLATRQGLQTELPAKAVGQLPAEHTPEVKFNNGHQVKEAFLQRNICDRKNQASTGVMIFYRSTSPGNGFAGSPGMVVFGFG